MSNFPKPSEALIKAIRAGCEAWHQSPVCIYPRCKFGKCLIQQAMLACLRASEKEKQP